MRSVVSCGFVMETNLVRTRKTPGLRGDICKRKIVLANESHFCTRSNLFTTFKQNY